LMCQRRRGALLKIGRNQLACVGDEWNFGSGTSILSLRMGAWKIPHRPGGRGGGISKHVLSVCLSVRPSVHPSFTLSACKVDNSHHSCVVCVVDRMSNKGCEAACKVCDFFKGVDVISRTLHHTNCHSTNCKLCWLS